MNKMNHIVKRKFSVLFLLVIILSLLKEGPVSYAASATIQITSKEKTVAVGETISVQLTINADTSIGGFEAFLLYDSDLMEFKTGGSCVKGGDGLLKISDVNSNDFSNTKTYSILFKTKDVGVSEIAIQDKAMVYDGEDGLEMSVSNNNLYLNIQASKKASTNSNLKSLKISPGVLHPDFNKNETKYTTSVSNDSAELIVSALAENNKAKTYVTGASDLIAGDNTVIIKVVAESGDEKEYTIVVSKEADNKNQDSVVNEENDEGIDITDQDKKDTFKVVNESGNLYISNAYRYQIVPADPDTVIPSGYVKTKLILSGENVTAYSLGDDPQNDIFLIYAMNEAGEKQFYRYDRVEKTMQRYMEASHNNNIGNINQVESNNQNQKKIDKLTFTVAILSAFLIIAIIIIIRFILKWKGYRNDDFE